MRSAPRTFHRARSAPDAPHPDGLRRGGPHRRPPAVPAPRGWATSAPLTPIRTKEMPMEYSMVIDGRSVTTGQWDDVINPAKGEPFAQCPRGTQANVEDAVTAAARAFKTWRTDEAVRRQKLNECAAAIQGRVQDIAAVLSQEQGKPMTAAMAEVFGASMWFSYYANLPIEAETLQDDGEKTIKVVRKPLAVVAAITPW